MYLQGRERIEKEKKRRLESESGAKEYNQATEKLGGPSRVFSHKEYNGDEIFKTKLTKFSSDTKKPPVGLED